MNDELNVGRRQQLEMGGYESGRRGENVCYQNADWSETERAAYRKGYEQGLQMHARLEKGIR